MCSTVYVRRLTRLLFIQESAEFLPVLLEASDGETTLYRNKWQLGVMGIEAGDKLQVLERHLIDGEEVWKAWRNCEWSETLSAVPMETISLRRAGVRAKGMDTFDEI